MIRSTVCSLLVLSPALLARADEPPAVQKAGPQNCEATPPDKVVLFRRLPVMENDSPVGKGFTEIIEAANNELMKGKTPEQVGKVLAETAEKMVAHARKHATDVSSLTGLVQAIGLMSEIAGSEKVRAEAIDLIKEHFEKTKAIRPHLADLAGGLNTAGADLVRSVFKDHPDPLTRAQAAKALIAGQSQRERTAEAFAKKDKPDIDSWIEKKILGADGVTKLLGSVANEKKAVEEYRAALRKELKDLLPDLALLLVVSAPGRFPLCLLSRTTTGSGAQVQCTSHRRQRGQVAMSHAQARSYWPRRRSQQLRRRSTLSGSTTTPNSRRCRRC
jgi:hypothetical protein